MLGFYGAGGLPLEAVEESVARIKSELGDLPAGFFDYLRYLWIADGERAWQAFGEPVYTTKEAWVSFFSSRRTERLG